MPHHLEAMDFKFTELEEIMGETHQFLHCLNTVLPPLPSARSLVSRISHVTYLPTQETGKRGEVHGQLESANCFCHEHLTYLCLSFNFLCVSLACSY